MKDEYRDIILADLKMQYPHACSDELNIYLKEIVLTSEHKLKEFFSAHNPDATNEEILKLIYEILDE